MTPSEINPDDLTPTFLDKDEEALYAEFMLGQEAITFLNSDLGKMMRGMAKQDINESAYKLLETNPTDIDVIKELQFKAAVAGNFLKYIQEILTRAEASEQVLQDYRKN